MRCSLLLLVALWSGSAGAQTAELLPSPAQQCLRHAEGEGQQPEYPIDDYNAARPGRVQVVFEFTAPDRAPEVSILLQEGGAPFADSVRRYAKGLRLPCMAPASTPLKLSQDFVFSPGMQRVGGSGPEDPERQRRKAMLGCVVHAKGWRVPEYPTWARREDLQGRVLVRARYANATDAPQLEVFSRAYAQRLAKEIKAWMLETRLPCHAGEPVTGVWQYDYILDRQRYGFNELTFRQFLSNVKGVRAQTLQLDTHTMGCPFDVQLSYRQPEMPNAVRVLAEPNAARQPLLQWLAASELDLPSRTVDAVWADTARITIPCLKIDLKPKEKS